MRFKCHRLFFVARTCHSSAPKNFSIPIFTRCQDSLYIRYFLCTYQLNDIMQNKYKDRESLYRVRKIEKICDGEIMLWWITRLYSKLEFCLYQSVKNRSLYLESKEGIAYIDYIIFYFCVIRETYFSFLERFNGMTSKSVNWILSFVFFYTAPMRNKKKSWLATQYSLIFMKCDSIIYSRKDDNQNNDVVLLLLSSLSF